MLNPLSTRYSKDSLVRGFTVTEVLIVIVVVVILALITTISYTGIQNRAAEASLKSDLNQAFSQLEIDYTFRGGYPDSMSEAADGSGLATSPGNTFRYSYDSTDDTFCLTASSDREGVPDFHISTTSTMPLEGACPEHESGGDDDDDPPVVALECPTGFIEVPGSAHYGTSDFCVMQYEAKDVGGVPTSQINGTPWVAVSRADAIDVAQDACASGCELISEAQWMTIVMSIINVDSNWSGGLVGEGTINRGNSDTSAAMDGVSPLSGINKRTHTLSNGEIIWDMSGNVDEWTKGTISSNQPGTVGQSGWAWVDFSNSNLTWNGLPSESRPTGVLYSGSKGVGGLWSDPTATTTHAFVRGGHWNSGSGAGLFTLRLSYSANYPQPYVGFRVTKSLDE